MTSEYRKLLEEKNKEMAALKKTVQDLREENTHLQARYIYSRGGITSL